MQGRRSNPSPLFMFAAPYWVQFSGLPSFRNIPNRSILLSLQTMNRSRLVLLYVLGFFAFGCAHANELGQDSLVGVWSGEVVEGDVTYDLTMTIRELRPGQVAGTAAYSGTLNCVGTLTFEGGDEAVFSFTEAIDDETVCADDGHVEIRHSDSGGLHWEWFRSQEESQPEAVADLQRNR